MKNKLILVSLIGATAIAFASQSLLVTKNDDKASHLINTVLQNQATVEKTIPVNKDLQAYVLSAKANGHKAIAFGDTNNEYLILGNVINNKGVNLTQQYTEQYVMPDMLKETFSNLKNTSMFAEGSSKAKHHVVVAIDPNCIYCHLLYQELQPEIKKGNLHVHWLLVGLIKPSSIDKATAILAGKTTADKIANLKQDEDNFNKQNEEGGITLNSNDNNVITAKKQIENNTKFFVKAGYEGTPVMLYNDKNGQPKAISGYVKGEDLTKAIEQMGDHKHA